MQQTLHKETVKIDNMQRGKLTSVLPIEIGDFSTEIHLFGPYANMRNIQQFIAEVLVALLPEEEE